MIVKYIQTRRTQTGRRVNGYIELNRSEYTRGKGTRQLYVARWSLPPGGELPATPPAKLTERITDTEREQLAAWWEKALEAQGERQRELNRILLPAYLDDAVEHLAGLKNLSELTDDQQKRVRERGAALGKQLVRLGLVSGSKRKTAAKKPATATRKPAARKAAAKKPSTKRARKVTAPPPKVKTPMARDRLLSVINAAESRPTKEAQ